MRAAHISMFPAEVTRRRTLRALATILASVVTGAQATDIAPGDYAVSPPRTVLALYYGQYSVSRSLEFDSATDAADARLNVNTNLLRFVRYGELRGLPYAVQTIIPFGSFVEAEVNGLAQKTADGLGDVVVAASIYPVRTSDGQGAMTVGLTTFLSLPTGSYDVDALSIGAGTPTFTLQLGVIRGLSGKLSLDGAVDITLTADHTERDATYSQEAQMQLQGYLRYASSGRTNISFGYAGFFGGKRYIDNTYQGLSSEGHQLRGFIDAFIDPTIQLQAMVGHDLYREGGFERPVLLQVRLMKAFR